MPRFCQTNPFSGSFCGVSGDLYVYGHGWRNVAFGTAGGLEALEFAQGLVGAALYLVSYRESLEKALEVLASRIRLESSTMGIDTAVGA